MTDGIQVFHCADATYTVMKDWIIGEPHIKTLCGLELSNAGPTYFANMFMDQSAKYRCPECRGHPDLGLLCLSFYNEE